MNMHSDPQDFQHTQVANLQPLLQRQKTAFDAEPNPDWPTRKGWLKALDKMLDKHADTFVRAIAASFFPQPLGVMQWRTGRRPR